MIGNHVHGLFDKSCLLHFHAGGRHRESLARTDDMAKQRISAAHAPPYGVLLVWSKLNGLVHAGEIEVRAVEQAGTQIVVRVVVNPYEALSAFRVREYPGAEAFLDKLLLLAGSHCRFLIGDSLLA